MPARPSCVLTARVDDSDSVQARSARLRADPQIGLGEVMFAALTGAVAERTTGPLRAPAT